MNRDSLLWWVGLAVALFAYLSAAPSPTQWTYAEWIQFGAAVLAWLAGKLATSPLPGADKDGGL